MNKHYLFHSIILYLGINIVLSPLLSFATECPKIFKLSPSKTFLSVNKAPQHLKYGLTKTTLKAKGFPSFFFNGVNEADYMINVADHLRHQNGLANQHHITDFSDLIRLHIAYIEKGLLQLQKNTKSIKEIDIIHRNLQHLEVLKSEANNRNLENNVSYEWWIYFNLRLTLTLSITTPSYFDRSFIEIISSKINKTKLFLLRNTSVTEVNKRKNKEAKKRLMYLDKLEYHFFSNQNTYSLEQIEFFYSKLDQLTTTPLSVHLNKTPFLDFNAHSLDHNIIEAPFGSLILNFIKALAFLSKTDPHPPITNYVLLYELMSDFPNQLFFPTTKSLGIMAFNRLGLPRNIYPIEINNKITRTDGLPMTPEFYALHDIEHVFLQTLLSAEKTFTEETQFGFHEYFNHYLNSLSLSKRERTVLEIIYFIHIEKVQSCH